MSTPQRVLTGLDFNLVVLPPKRSSYTSPSVVKCPVQYHDLVAIDVALLPDQEQSQWIIKNLNNPLIPFGSFPLDESHFPHMSLVHTIVPRAALPQLCAEIQTIAEHFDIVIKHWYSLVQSQSHPFYNYNSSNGDNKTFGVELKSIPHLKNNDETLTQFLSSCQDYSLAPIDQLDQPNNETTPYNCKSYYKPLFSINSSTSPDQSPISIPSSFDWTVVSPGPMWTGDTTLPYIGYPNPLLTDDMSTNGLNIRILHDLITTMIHPYRVSIWEAQSRELSSSSADTKVDMKTIETNGDESILDAISQVVYFTGDTIQETQIDNDGKAVLDQTVEYPSFTQSQSQQNTISVLNSPVSFITNHNDIKGDQAKHHFYTTPTPFDAEPADSSTLKYTNAFDEKYMGSKYNPHITIGSGEPEKVKEFILTTVKLDPSEDVSRYLKKDTVGSDEVVEKKPYFKMEPIKMDLNHCMIGVFQLGLRGSCRFPIFKTGIGGKK